MIRPISLALVFLAMLASGGRTALANSPEISGTWEVTGYDEPGRNAVDTICVSFVRTNDIQNVTMYSGTWTALNVIAPVAGEWIQLGDRVYMWARVALKNVAFSLSGNLVTKKFMGGESYVGFDMSSGLSLVAGSFVAKKKNCGAESASALFGLQLQQDD
jgi:hypothetical protein